MPRPSIPPALGGRGTERGATDPRSGIRALLFGAAARFGMFSAGRCALRAFSFCALPIRALLFGAAARFGMFSAGRCTPRALPVWVLPITGRSVFLPMPAVGVAGWNDPRLPAGGATWLTTGLANVLCGGTAAALPALAPSTVVLVGFTSRAWTGVIRLSWFGATRIALCATGREFTSVSRDTAVNPFGERIFA